MIGVLTRHDRESRKRYTIVWLLESVEMNKEMIININGVNHWVKLSLNNNHKYPIIVLHGGPGGFNYVYERVPGKLLEENLDIIYYEQRGCGRSDYALNNKYAVEDLISDLNELIHELSLDKVILLGYSFGAELAAEYAVKYPRQIAKLILQSPSYFVDMKLMFDIQHENFKNIGIKFEKFKSENIVDKYNEMWSKIDQDTVDDFLFHDLKNAVTMRRLWDDSGLINTGKMSEQVFNRKRRISLFQELIDIEIPTLIIVGKNDNNVSMTIPRKYHDSMKCSEMIVFENSGHFPDFEESVKYQRVIENFVNHNQPIV